ncbi:TIR domain-containing protein [Hyalangium sp.]|uniref:TIR domain-containing protein n=1 Tax=Hyalangium sp. TaxID=2028555 RepID=UPI002D52D412|nr:TIR domain-containing protein [Hyalangium sp.]HYH96879.1 TIR domain-containing protein [Hyalangium sp.]
MADYDAFISYSHKANSELAHSLQTALRQLAKPWYKLSALAVYRDVTDLSAAPNLWPRIQAALKRSRYLLLLASPEAAQSKWVERELRVWQQEKSLDTLVIAVTGGEIEWDEGRGDFNWEKTNCIPTCLRGRFATEPLWGDFRGLQSGAAGPPGGDEFIRRVAHLSATIHGTTPWELLGLERTLRRRAAMVRLAALLVSILLAVVSSISAVYFYQQQQHSKQQAAANGLLARALLTERRDPTLAVRLAERSLQTLSSPVTSRLLDTWYEQSSPYALSIHHDRPISAAISSDGNWIVTVDWNTNLRLWTRTGQLLGTMPHPGEARALAVGPDTILTCGADGRVRIWSHSLSLLRTIGDPEHAATACAISARGDRIAIADEKGRDVRVWSREGEFLGRFNCPSTVLGLAFTADGDRLLTGHFEGTAALWTLGGKKLATFASQKGAITSIGSSPNGWVVTGNVSGVLSLWMEDGTLRWSIAAHERNIHAVAIDPRSQQILTAGGDGLVKVWSFEPRLLRTLRGHSDAVVRAEFLTNSPEVFTASWDGGVKLWWLQGSTVRVIESPAPVMGVAISPDGGTLAIANTDSSVQLVDLEGKSLQVLKHHQQAVWSIAFCRGGSDLLTGSMDTTAAIIELSTGRVTRLAGHSEPVSSVACAPDGSVYVTGSRDGSVRLWNAAGEGVFTFWKHEGPVTSVAVSPVGELIASGGRDGTVQLWSRSDEARVLVKRPNFINAIAFSPDGRRLLVGDRDGASWLYGLDDSTRLQLDRSREQILAVAFSRDGHRMMTAAADNIVRVWDADGLLLRSLSGHTSSVRAVAFTPDGRFLVSGSSDDTVRIWSSVLPLSEFLRSDRLAKFSQEEMGEEIHLPTPSPERPSP